MVLLLNPLPLHKTKGNRTEQKLLLNNFSVQVQVQWAIPAPWLYDFLKTEGYMYASTIAYPAYWKAEYGKQMLKGLKKWLPLPFQCNADI